MNKFINKIPRRLYFTIYRFFIITAIFFVLGSICAGFYLLHDLCVIYPDLIYYIIGIGFAIFVGLTSYMVAGDDVREEQDFNDRIARRLQED